MAHHRARLIVEARQAPPSERDLAEERCRHAILEIWRYRRTLNSPRPLASADQTLEAIRALQHQEGPWYFNYISQEAGSEPDKAIELARTVDSGARAILRYLFALSFASQEQDDQPWRSEEHT